ncbi:MAG: NAD(P)H-hydrate dehydratase [Clostridia bacterium]|nr:NAD(P)H-hydrate dehydratase [Clostridia bacterium]
MKVLDLEQIRYAEKTAVSSGLFSYADLMEKAGKAVCAEIVSRYDVKDKKVLIIAGNGNNGGDGLVCANLLRECGANVYFMFPIGIPKTDTAITFIEPVADLPVISDLTDSYDLYIDALFGIGLNRALTPKIEAIIEKLNSYKGIKIAVDVPSGVIADGGRSSKVFKADLTVTFIGYKLCQLLPDTSDSCGEIVLNTLDIDVKDNYSYRTIEPPIEKKFSKNSHKGTFGTTLHICGSYGMCGAAILAARASAVSGAGIVKSVVCDKNYTAFTQSVPEAVTVPVGTSADGTLILGDKALQTALLGASSLLIGCGLGSSDAVKTFVHRALQVSKVPTVLDADGINAIASDISILSKTEAPIIITPHPGEMAKLLNITAADVQSNRVKCAKKLACGYNCVVVLKGANTIVAAPSGEVYFNITGNYGMAKGGSGDVLSGIIAALLANGYDTLTAALYGVYVHGAAGDRAAKKYSKRGMLPSDIIRELKYISY